MSIVKKILLFQVSIIFSATSLHAMSQSKPRLGLGVTKLKGTHAILAEYPGCSPFYGLVFSEKNVLRNLYECSSFYNKTLGDAVLKDASADLDVLKKEVESYFKEDRSTGTQNLVRQMFNMPPGGTFNPTNAPNNPVAQLKPKDLGKILRIINDFSKDLVKMELELKNYMQNLGLKDPQGKPFAGKDFNPFVKSLVKSVQECDEKNPQAIFAKGTVQGVLLGYLLIKSNDRNDLQDYFEGFLNKSVTLPEEQYAAEQLKGFANQAPVLTNEESFADFVCGTLYQQIYASPLPKIITSNMKVDFKGARFTDCMECVMRNLCNIATYDAKNKKLGMSPKESSLGPSLQEFYNKHSDINDVTAKPAHQAWVDVVENVEGVAYHRIFTNPTPDADGLKLPSDCEGFIPMDLIDTALPSRVLSIKGKNCTVYEKQVGAAKYLLVPKSSDNICCELMPSTRNVIVLMNQALNLHLYSNPAETFEPGFENKYLQPMCQKFGWKVDSDSKDLTRGVNLKVSTESKQGFEIKLSYKAHGSVNIIENQKQTLMDAFDKGLPAQQAIATSLGLFDDKTNPKNDYYCDLQDPNRRVEKVVEIMKRDTIAGKMVAENLFTSIGFLQDPHYLNNALRHAPEGFLKAMKNTIFLQYLKYQSVDTLEEYFTINKKPICSKAEIVSIINNGLKTTDKHVQRSSLSLAETAIARGVLSVSDKAYIVSIINDGLKGNYAVTHQESLSLAQIATAKGVFGPSDKAYIVSIINDGLKTNDEKFQRSSIFLAEIAIEKGILSVSDKDDIVSIINDGLKTNDEKFQRSSMLLAETAIATGVLSVSDKAYIVSIINDGLKGNYAVTHQESLSLAQTAIEKGIVGESDKADIVSIINNGLKANDKLTKKGSILLAQIAIEKGILSVSDKDDIVSIINNGLESHDQNLISNSLYLAGTAIEKGIVGESDKIDILSWINQGMQAHSAWDRNKAKALKELVEKKYPNLLKNPTGSSSMLDSARGVGGFRGTPVYLMRKTFDQQMQEQFPENSTEFVAPEVQELPTEQITNQFKQKRFVPPSSEELSAQRNQTERFNSGYDSSLQTKNIFEQQRLMREHAAQRSINQQRLSDQKTLEASRLASGALKVDSSKMKQLVRSAIK